MQVTCPQCHAEQRLSMKEASLFWAVCKECGLVHGPATTQAGEVLSMPPAAPVVDQPEESTDWEPASEMFEDILALGGEGAEDRWPEGELLPPRFISGVTAAAPAGPPTHIALPAPASTAADLAETQAPLASEVAYEAEYIEEDIALPADNEQTVVYLSEPTEARSESASVVDMPQPAELLQPAEVPQPPELPQPAELPQAAELPQPIQLSQPTPALHELAGGARVRRIGLVRLLLICVGLLGVCLISWPLLKPASEVGQGAAGPASGGQKTKVTNQSGAKAPTDPKAPTNPKASVDPTPKSVNTAPAEAQGAKAQAAKEAETVAAPNARETGEGDGGFTAQVGSYNNISNANERVSALRAAGFEARAVKAEIPGRGVWYRVQSGRFGTRGEAARFGERLRAQGVAGQIIITEIGKQ